MPAGSLRRDIVSAYVLAACRVLAWVVIAAVVYRTCRPRYFAALALVRATVGLLGYTSLGLGPSMVRALAGVQRYGNGVRFVAGQPLSYARPTIHSDPVAVWYASGTFLAMTLAVIGVGLTLLYSTHVDVLHTVYEGPSWDGYGAMHRQFGYLAITMGLATVMRMLAEPASAMLQAQGRVTADNAISAAGELLWAAASCLMLLGPGSSTTENVGPVGTAYFVAMTAVWAAKRWVVQSVPNFRPPAWAYFDWRAAWSLVSFGALVVVAQAADFLYAPTDYILINRLLDPEDVATYAPAVQIDGGLLLLVTGLAAVLFPHTAVAHAAGDRAAVRAYYVRGTLASLGLLTVAALGVWAASPWLFRVWLGQPMTATQAILPLVLVHTVVGGSAAVGRSVLLGMGKVGAFTAAVLVSGIANVVLSYCFVRFGGMGLNGIVLGTIIAVVGRAGVWMPWYTLRAIRRMEGPLRPESAEGAVLPV